MLKVLLVTYKVWHGDTKTPQSYVKYDRAITHKRIFTTEEDIPAGPLTLYKTMTARLAKEHNARIDGLEITISEPL